MKTVGASPKLYGGLVATLVAFLATQELMDLPPWADLLVMLAAVGFGIYQPGPGTVQAGAPRGWRNERGMSAVDALIIVFLAVVILIVIDRLL